MNLVLPGAAAILVLAAAAFALLFRRMISQGSEAPLDLEWCREFSLAKYRPMERLFANDDYDFLAAQPGFHPRIYRKLQAERRRVFRRYLRCLSRDFSRLSAAARLVLVHSSQDRPDLAAALFKQRMIFTGAMAAVHFRLVLQTLGVGTVDVRGLVAALEGMRDQLRQLSPSVEASTI